ncbi:MAG: NHL repeat-containing protein [Phycisphaerales bacterium]
MTIRDQLFALVILAIAASSALAVKPGQWVQDTEAAFGSASLDQTIVTNLGRIELARASEKLADLKDDATIIYDIARLPGGQTFLAVGPAGELASLDPDNKIVSVAKYENAQVFALAVDGDALWVAVSGNKTSRLEKREAGKVTRTIDLPDVRYIWDMLVSDGKLYLATGTDGKVLQVDPAAASETAAAPPASDEQRATSDEKNAATAPGNADTSDEKTAASAPPISNSPALVVVLDCEQNNVLCLGIDAQKRLYAGTDTEGLVYRITPQPAPGSEEPGSKEPASKEHPFSAYVIYDAAEPEIGAMVVMPDGTVYVGTADADQAKPGRLNEPAKEEQGKPAPAAATGR